MKQVLFLLTTMIVIFACNDSTKVASTNDDKMNDHAKATENMKEVYRAIETGDVSKMDSLMTDDCVDHNANPDGSDIKGKDSIKKMLSQIHTYFEPGMKMEMLSDAVSEDGDYHFALVRMTGKAKANPWGIPAGQDVDDTSVDVVKLKSGKACDHWGFMSNGDIMEMMKGMQSGTPPAKDAKK
jgi:ketosteroid isomerase-like protein